MRLSVDDQNINNINNIIDDTIDNNKVNIIFCVDEKNRFPMYTLINSIIQNERPINRQRLYFHVLVLQNASLYTQEVEHYFGEYLNEISFNFQSIIDDHPECIEYTKTASKHLPEGALLNTVMNHARFCAPNVFKNVEIGIYLDVDMIVQDSISKIYDHYFKRNYSAWSVMNRGSKKEANKTREQRGFVDDYFHTLRAKYPSVIKGLNWKKLRKGRHLFNAGILMFNLTVWRTLDFTAQSLELYEFNSIYKERFGDKPWTGVTQPIINILFMVNHIKMGHLKGEWNFIVKDLIRKWNCNAYYTINKRQKAILESQSILHFADRCKPWIVENLNVGYLWTKYIPNNVNISEWEQEFNITIQRSL